MADNEKPESPEDDDATELIDRETLLRRARAQAEEEDEDEDQEG